MAKKKDRKKPITASRPAAVPVTKAKAKSAAPRQSVASAPARPMTFGKESLIWMSGGFGLVILGMLLMTGGEMPDPTVWDEGIIYSFRRITLAPIEILAGIGVTIYAILKK